VGSSGPVSLLGAEEASSLVATEAAAVILLAIAAGVAVLAKRFSFPYTVALVVAGFGASALGEVVRVEVSPELILALLVPPLLFEATLHLPWAKLRADLTPVLLFALVGTFVGTLAIGALVQAALGLPWAAALAFGALISATDPVAVIAFFKALGAPKRLSVLVEGESLFNDAVAVVAFGLALAAADATEAFSVGDAALQFVVVSAGGLAVGLIFGYLVSAVFLAQVDDPLIETSTTLALAYGSFLVAEYFGRIIGQPDFHFSGILAVVAAGLMVGNLGFTNTSPPTRLTLEHFWELLTFLVNSLVFLLIGLEISFSTLADHLPEVLLGVVAVLALRFVLVHTLATVAAWIQPERRVPRDYRNVMVWAGLRGAISLALVLTITTDHFDQDTVDTLQAMTFGVVLFTLLIQGTTITGLMRRLGLTGSAEAELTQQRHQARIHMTRAGEAEIRRLGGEGVVFADLADALASTYERDAQHHAAQLRGHLGRHPELETAMLLQARREALTAERTALADVVRSGLIETAVAQDLGVELSNRMAVLDLLEERWESDPRPTFERSGAADVAGKGGPDVG
jgi:CPA1 family monovalent cation:H+ antiporter